LLVYDIIYEKKIACIVLMQAKNFRLTDLTSSAFKGSDQQDKSDFKSIQKDLGVQAVLP